MEDDNVHDAENPVLVCLVTDVVDDDNDIREGVQKNVFFGRSFPNLLPTHPRVFVRFGKTKGELWVEKVNFRGHLGGF